MNETFLQHPSPLPGFSLNCAKGQGREELEKGLQVLPQNADSEPIPNLNITVYLTAPKSLCLNQCPVL